MDCTPPVQWEPGSVHGISQAKILEWVAISFSKGSSWPRNWTHVSCIGRQILYHWASREALTASARRLITTKRSFSDENSVSFIKKNIKRVLKDNLFSLKRFVLFSRMNQANLVVGGGSGCSSLKLRWPLIHIRCLLLWSFLSLWPDRVLVKSGFRRPSEIILCLGCVLSV